MLTEIQIIVMTSIKVKIIKSKQTHLFKRQQNMKLKNVWMNLLQMKAKVNDRIQH